MWTATPEEPTSGEVFDKWIDNGDNTWTYRFHVYDADFTYYGWESALQGYSWTYSTDGTTWVDADSLPAVYTATGTLETPPIFYVKNTRTEASGTGGLQISKTVECSDGSDPSQEDLAKEFNFVIRLYRMVEEEGQLVKQTATDIDDYYGNIRFRQGCATVTLTSGDSISSTGIPTGLYYDVYEEEAFTDGFDTKMYVNGQLVEPTVDMQSGTAFYTVSGIIGDNNTQYVVAHNIRVTEGDEHGNLRVDKTVYPAEGTELSEADMTRKFTFHIRFSGTYEIDGVEYDAADLEGVFGTVPVSGGECTFQLAHDEHVDLTYLPVGIHYIVTETSADEFTTTWEGNTGVIPGEDENGEEGWAYVHFYNTRDEEDVPGGFTLIKKIVGKVSDKKFKFYIDLSGLVPNMEYSYTITGQEEPVSFTALANGTAQIIVELGHNESAVFAGLPSGSKYRIMEEASEFLTSYTITDYVSVEKESDTNTVIDQSLYTANETVDQDENAVVTFTNSTPEFTVLFTKQDTEAAGVPGAVLAIYPAEQDDEGEWYIPEGAEAVSTWTTSGDIDRIKIYEGTFILKEITPPDGYDFADDVVFKVDERGRLSVLDPETGVFVAQNVCIMIDEPFWLEVQKQWNDGNGTNRPESITVHLKQYESPEKEIGQTVFTAVLNAENEWHAVADGLPKYQEDGSLYYYEWFEDETGLPHGYERLSQSTEGILTTIINRLLTSLEIEKIMTDGSDADNEVEFTFTVEFGEPVTQGNVLHYDKYAASDTERENPVTEEVTVGEGGKVTVTLKHGELIRFYDLPENTSYEVTEESHTGYTLVSSTGTTGTTALNVTPKATFTNAPSVVSLNGIKEWSDSQDADGIRPSSVTIVVKAGEEVAAQTTATSPDWTWTVTGLREYDASGNLITYTVTESPEPMYYTSQVTQDEESGQYTVTNTHTPEYVSAKVIKSWDDEDDNDRKRPDTLAVTLKANGEDLNPVKTVTLSESNQWTDTVNGLPKYKYTFDDDGNVTGRSDIEYTWVEATLPEGYQLTNTQTADLTDDDNVVIGKVTTLTNSYGTEKVNVTVYKTWEDSAEDANNRPSSVTVQLKGNGQNSGSSQVLSDSNGWTYTWENLYKKSNGTDIDYTVEEVEVPAGYEAVITKDANNVYSITINNRHLGRLEVTKTLVGGDTNKTFSFTLVLKDDDEEVISANETYSYLRYAAGRTQGTEGTVTGDSEGKVQFNLKDGERIVFTDLPVGAHYTVTEESGSYTVESSGTTGTTTSTTTPTAAFTNTVKPVTLPLPVKKTVNGNPPASQEQSFTFTLERVSENAPMPSSNTVTVVGAGEGTFEGITYDSVGTYTYTITETEGTAPGYVYDTTPREIVVTVTDNNGQLAASYTCDGQTVQSVEFINEYESGDLMITKMVAGDAADPEKYFTFTVTFKMGEDDLEGEFPYTIGSFLEEEDEEPEEGETEPETGDDDPEEEEEELFISSGGSLQLKHGEYALITGLPAGCSYEVVESDNDDYVMTSEGTEGDIVKDETAEADFLNTKTNPPDTGEERLPMNKMYMIASLAALLIFWLIADKKRSKKAEK